MTPCTLRFSPNLRRRKGILADGPRVVEVSARTQGLDHAVSDDVRCAPCDDAPIRALVNRHTSQQPRWMRPWISSSPTCTSSEDAAHCSYMKGAHGRRASSRSLQTNASRIRFAWATTTLRCRPNYSAHLLNEIPGWEPYVMEPYQWPTSTPLVWLHYVGRPFPVFRSRDGRSSSTRNRSLEVLSASTGLMHVAQGHFSPTMSCV